jgi:hypothetical protein
MDEYTLTLIGFLCVNAAAAIGYWLGVTVERDKWRRRAQISWELRRQQSDRVKL